MYGAHRAPPAQQNARLSELLDSVRVEFQDQAARTAEYEQQRKFAFLQNPKREDENARSRSTALFKAVTSASSVRHAN